MIVGVPKEIKPDEKRVSVLPHLVKTIVNLGHEVLVQNGAGKGSGISDSSYVSEGASIVKNIEEVYKKSDIKFPS